MPSSMMQECIQAFPASGEINSRLQDAKQSSERERVRTHDTSLAKAIDSTKASALKFDQWHVNLRSSNTEPIARLNGEIRNNTPLIRKKTVEILDILKKGIKAQRLLAGSLEMQKENISSASQAMRAVDRF